MWAPWVSAVPSVVDAPCRGAARAGGAWGPRRSRASGRESRPGTSGCRGGWSTPRWRLPPRPGGGRARARPRARRGDERSPRRAVATTPRHDEHADGTGEGDRGERARDRDPGDAQREADEVAGASLLPPPEEQPRGEHPQRGRGALREVGGAPHVEERRGEPEEPREQGDPGPGQPPGRGEEESRGQAVEEDRHEAGPAEPHPRHEQERVAGRVLGGEARGDEDVVLLEELGKRGRVRAEAEGREDVRLQPVGRLVVDERRLAERAPGPGDEDRGQEEGDRRRPPRLEATGHAISLSGRARRARRRTPRSRPPGSSRGGRGPRPSRSSGS